MGFRHAAVLYMSDACAPLPPSAAALPSHDACVRSCPGARARLARLLTRARACVRHVRGSALGAADGKAFKEALVGSCARLEVDVRAFSFVTGERDSLQEARYTHATHTSHHTTRPPPSPPMRALSVGS